MDTIHDLIVEMKDTIRKFINDPEIYKLQATLMKNWVDALVKEGFSRKEAVTILCANPLIRINQPLFF